MFSLEDVYVAVLAQRVMEIRGPVTSNHEVCPQRVAFWEWWQIHVTWRCPGRVATSEVCDSSSLIILFEVEVHKPLCNHFPGELLN